MVAATAATFWNFVEHGLDGWIGFQHRSVHRSHKFLVGLFHLFVSGLDTRILHCFLSRCFQFFSLFG